MASKDRNPERAVQLIADNMTHLEHPKTKQVLRLVGFQGPGAEKFRIMIAEAIVDLLRKDGHMKPAPKKGK